MHVEGGTELGAEEARRYLVAHLGLRRMRQEAGAAGLEALLVERGMIQLDPLDRIGTNADLVVQARLDGIRRGEVYRLLPERAFEHFAKERCLLPAAAFPYYREECAGKLYWRFGRHLEPPSEELLAEVEAEVAERGPVTASDLTDRGRMESPDWGFTARRPLVNSLALEVLWYACRVVVAGRSGKGKRYDVPSRALPDWHDALPETNFRRWALLERVRACGLLSVNAGPQWGLLRDARKSALPDELVQEGLLEVVSVRGSRRRYLAPARFRETDAPEDDGRMRILGPLDPLLWDRTLVRQIFGFDYVWEVYKPASRRIWGYYVCPILHRGRLVGRFEGRRQEGRIQVENLWIEDGAGFDRQAWRRCLERLAALQ